jgi:oxalate decarboxylase/phosphoglucose isomerase-like protein (cupin superfamily)
MRFNTNNIGGDIIKANGVYTLRDNKTLTNLVLSQTILHCSQHTNGHYHAGQEEVYFFCYGKGEMLVGDDKFTVTGGDIVLITDGMFHKVWNVGESDLIFNCVFNGKRYEQPN